jgi:uncharacterized membrane protein
MPPLAEIARSIHPYGMSDSRSNCGGATAVGVVAVLLALVGPARADLQLCNRMSYVVEAALGIEDKGAAATRGWFRIEPGRCRTVLQGEVEAQHLYIHARTLAVYGASPQPQSGNADLCVAQGNFVIAGARHCRSGQFPARFAAIKPSESDKGLTANLAEEAEYDEEQARLAGIQRLLVMAGYDASPIDGVQGPKTEAALAQFIKDRKLAAEAASAANFFDILIEAAEHPDGAGFAWCNDTAHPVMAALGVDDKGAFVTRGWYRVEPGKCLRPEVRGRPRRLYSFAEAVGVDGRTVMRAGRPLVWGGDTMLCTREAKFELSDHKDCAASGLAASGFAAIDLAGRGSMTVRFKE